MMWNARCESASERTGAKGEAEWEGWGAGGMSLFSHLSHAQMFGETRWRIGGLGPEQGGRKKVKETTSERELRAN